MGMNTILMLIMGIAMTAIIGSQVAPSMIEQIKATKVEVKSINNQEVIFEAVKRYITMKQTNPTSLQDIINEQFLNAKVNDNGFGGGYSIEIDGSKGLLKVKTTIEDPKAQEIFLNSFKNKFIPTRVGTTNEFETTFVIPTDIMHGRGLFMTGIPVQATPPTDTSLKYWYDTSGKEVALRMYDPNSDSWKKVAGTGGSGSISESALVDASGNNFTKDTLPTTNAEVGEIKYAYDSITNSIQEYVYTGNTQGWVVKGGGGSPQSYPKSCLEYKTYGITIYPYINSDNDGVYKIDPDGRYGLDPFEVYCDMSTDGGGWTLVGFQNRNSLFPDSIVTEDINKSNFGSIIKSWRLGNFLIQSIKPTVAWKMESRSNYNTIIDKAYVKPTCVIDWGNNISDYYVPDSKLNFSKDCQYLYTDIYFNNLMASVNDNASYGIGSNNSGQYCSMRFSNIPSQYVSISSGGGAWARPCIQNNYNVVDMYLWFK